MIIHTIYSQNDYGDAYLIRSQLKFLKNSIFMLIS